MKRYLLTAVMLLSIAAHAPAQEKSLSLPLKEAIKLAVEKNLDVQAALYTPASAAADIYKYLGIYDPLLSLQAGYQDSTNLSSYIVVTGGKPVSRVSSTTYNAGVTQLLPFGATVGAAFDNSWNHQNYGINNYFQSDLTLTFTQPLLKGFGRETTEISINVARFNKEGALEQFKSRLLDIVYQVKSQYYQLYSLRENVEVKRASLNLAETILKNTKAEVKAGVLPAMEIINAEFGVASQQKAVIDAERALRDQVDALRLLLQLPEVTEIVPVDAPVKERYDVDDAREIQLAMDARPDLRQLRASLKTSELQSRVARNQTLPQLDFNASAALTGLDNHYNRDLEQVGSGRYPVWIAGLKLTYPIGNEAAKNDYIKSKLAVEQNRTQLKSLEETIDRDVRIAVRAVRSGYLQLDVTARGRSYAEEVLNAYIKKQKVGLATTKDVLDELNNLVTAQGNEIQAVSDYNVAIVNLWKTTGELLEREGITLGEKEADSLYEKNK